MLFANLGPGSFAKIPAEVPAITKFRSRLFGEGEQGGIDETALLACRRRDIARRTGLCPKDSSDTITVGFTESQTGPLNVDSLGLVRGAEMWRDEVNAAGGIKAGGKSYKVQFVTYDDQSVGGRVQQLYTRLIVQDNAQFLFSPYSSGLTAAAAVVSEQYGKIMLDGGGAEAKPFMLGNKYLFMVITPAGSYLSGAVAALAQKEPHAKIAMVYSDDPFSKAVLAAAEGSGHQGRTRSGDG